MKNGYQYTFCVIANSQYLFFWPIPIADMIIGATPIVYETFHLQCIDIIPGV